MPNLVIGEMNRAASTFMLAAEFGAASSNFCAYTRQVTIEKGVSLTGFVASAQIAVADVDPNNLLSVFLLENILVNNDSQILSQQLQFERGLFFYRTVFTGAQGIVEKTFDIPFQLRYGYAYSLIALVRTNALPPANPVNLHFTAFGFDNEDKVEGIKFR